MPGGIQREEGPKHSHDNSYGEGTSSTTGRGVGLCPTVSVSGPAIAGVAGGWYGSVLQSQSQGRQ